MILDVRDLMDNEVTEDDIKKVFSELNDKEDDIKKVFSELNNKNNNGKKKEKGDLK